MSTPFNTTSPMGAAPGVQAVVITREQKAAGLSPEQVQAQLSAQAMQENAQASMGSRGVQVRLVKSATAVTPAQGVTSPALQTRIFTPPTATAPEPTPHPPGAVQSGVPPEGAEGAIDGSTDLSLEAELSQLDEGTRAELARSLAAARYAREQEERARIEREQLEQHELQKNAAAFLPAGDPPRVDVQRVVMRVNVSGAHRLQGGGPVVLEMRGPIEVIISEERGHADEVEAQTPRDEADESGKSEPGLKPGELEQEAERNEKEAGDHADDVKPDQGPISVGGEDEGAGAGGRGQDS